ncbi:MAG: DUF4332 domain-containing protein [Gemmatimonadales bacterium]
MKIGVPAVAIATSWLLLYLNVEPVPTWFYVFAWYPTLALLDAIATRTDDRSSALWHPSTISVLAWSAVIWLVFEAANLRLRNWYYVFLPQHGWERWSGILLSFATVLPALFLAERALNAAGLFRRSVPRDATHSAAYRRERGIPIRGWELHAAMGLGVTLAVLALGFPKRFFPLIWSAGFLIADPFVYKRDPSLSLIADIERGDPGRIGRLMSGGLGIGMIWETYNFWARGKWIYTVPWLEHTKLFEMPPFGFVGFPVFALEAWSMYAALCALGVAQPMRGHSRIAARRLGPAIVLAIGFVAVTLAAMEHRTISSTVPQLAKLPGITPASVRALEAAGVRSPFTLAERAVREVTAITSLSVADATNAVTAAQLATLRGIGTRYAQMMWRSGIKSVCDLSSANTATLAAAVELGRRPRPTETELRVWLRAAKEKCNR